MWDEYFFPGLLISFIIGFLLGVNIGMLCLPKFFEPNVPQRNDFVIKHQQQQQQQPFMNSSVPPMRYPSGFTAKQLQQHDFTQRNVRSMPAIGANIRRSTNAASFSY